jgi:hypothetical protein
MVDFPVVNKIPLSNPKPVGLKLLENFTAWSLIAVEGPRLNFILKGTTP